MAVVFLDGGFTTDHDPTLSGFKRLADAFVTVNNASRREIGSLDVFHQLGDGDVVVVDVGDDAVNALAEVVWSHVGGHTDGDTVGTVDQQCRNLCRQHGRLLQGVIEVVLEVNGVLFEVVEHFLGDLLQAGLSVTHGSRAVAVNATKVTLPVHQWITQGPVLGHTHHGVVH